MTVLADPQYIEAGRREAEESRRILTQQFRDAFPNGERLLDSMLSLASANMGDDDMSEGALTLPPVPRLNLL